MRIACGIALALALAAGGAGCASGRAAPEPAGPAMDIKDVQVVWTRGGKLGYLETYDVAEKGGPKFRMHYVKDLEFRQRGWVSDDGQGERFDYPARRLAEAQREPFQRVELPRDSMENQIRRILQVDPLTEIALQRATAADLHR